MNDSIIANKKSKIFHDSSCYFGQLVLKENRAKLNTTFFNNGTYNYRACSRCSPIHPNQRLLDEFTENNPVEECANV